MSNSITPKIYIIIVTYKGHLWYERCFSSLRNSSIPVQTVVIDNASNDGTVEYIREKFPEIHLIESKENLGFGKANNVGMRYALENGCDYVFLLNQDAWVESETLENLINIHKHNLKYGILSPMHLNKSKNKIENGLLHYIADYNKTDFQLISDLYFANLKDIYETKYVNAAAWLLPRKTLLEIGGFDPIFSHYGEDDNYLQRVIYHGYKIGICPKQIVVHDTERRLNNKSIHTKNSYELISLTDINKSYYYTFIKYHFQRMFIYLFRLNIKKFNSHRKLYIFAKNKEKQILDSIKQNKQKESSWL